MSLPIVKTISYSSLTDWQNCPHFYKLVNVDGLKSFTSNIYSYWGSLIHRYVQAVLQDKMTPKEASERFARTWKKLCKLCKEPEYYDMYVAGCNTILIVKDRFKEEFGNYKILTVEKRLSQPVPEGEKYPQKFKGFIDLVMVLENGDFVIADLKTCDTSYMFNKYRDKYKDYQLTLYKYFYCQEYGINGDRKRVHTYFITLERYIKSKNPVQFARVTSGDKKINNALGWMNRALEAINAKIWIKNRTSCHKYGFDKPCVFYGTEHCK